MRKAIAVAERGFRAGQGGPFGACLVKKGKVLALAHNTVLAQKDPTCHAEINAIRIAAKKLRDFDLSGCEIYSTTEPCPMCFAAIHWAKIARVIYGTTVGEVSRRGFNELLISNSQMRRLGKSRVKIRAGFRKAECEDLLAQWDRFPRRKTY